MLKSIKLHSFKNHKETSYGFSKMNLIIGPNGSGKTNILESIYLLLNSYAYRSVSPERLVNFFDENFIVSGIIEEDLPREAKITYDGQAKKLTFILDGNRLSRPKYLQGTGHIAVFFEPLEMNIIYLGPTLRRDFLDEVSALHDSLFHTIRSDYTKILRNRNKMLKAIQENKAQLSDLHFWNSTFIKKAVQYYSHRKRFLDYINENISVIEDFLENKYSLSFAYDSKVDWDDIEGSITKYLEKNIERDVITGHTYIGPHLDDFRFMVKIGDKTHNSQECLSRGENKSILIGLKFLEIGFFRNTRKEEIVILLDDIFSELDDEHISGLMKHCRPYMTFISAQNTPSFLLDKDDISIINI